ncbi:hypothetical protein [Nocardia rhamnosiphila]
MRGKGNHHSRRRTERLDLARQRQILQTQIALQLDVDATGDSRIDEQSIEVVEHKTGVAHRRGHGLHGKLRTRLIEDLSHRGQTQTCDHRTARLSQGHRAPPERGRTESLTMVGRAPTERAARVPVAVTISLVAGMFAR